MSSARRTNGPRPVSERGRRAPQNQQSVTEKPQPRAKSSLLEREEEYKRLNAELEAKTAELVREAEAIMSEQENFLRHSSPSHTPDKDLSESQVVTHRKSPQSNLESLSIDAKFGLLDLVGSDNDTSDMENDMPSSDRTSSYGVKSVTSSKRASSARQPSRKIPSASAVRPVTQPSKKGSAIGRVQRKPKKFAADEVAIPDDFTSKLNLDDAISNIEKNMGENYSARDDDDIMPAAAVEMGSEAQIRFLKAKLRVMQEELERLSQESRSGAEERKKMTALLKDANEEQARLQKMNNAQQTQIEKHKRLLEEEKKKSESVGTQVQTLRKELEGIKREQKQSSVAHNATEVRLNRALEDVERYKTQFQKDKHLNKESAENDRREMDRLRSDNKRLERLKNDMNTVFKKQQKLISILKRQILHIEAAKLLSFTEEEFVKALDWGSK